MPSSPIMPLKPIASRESPRQILEADFEDLRGRLPISGGWGYTQDDACVIDKDDPVVDPDSFDGVGLEYLFVQRRTCEEMIVFRPKGEKFSNIEWKPLQQSLHSREGRSFDRLIFEITAIHDRDLEELTAEYNESRDHGSPGWDEALFQRKLEERRVSFTREFWFDITSFFYG